MDKEETGGGESAVVKVKVKEGERGREVESEGIGELSFLMTYVHHGTLLPTH